MVMHSFHTDGYLRSTATNETWAWKAELARPQMHAVTALIFKVECLAASLMSYAIISAASAIVLRVLIASGTLLVGGVSSLLQYCGSRYSLPAAAIIAPYTWLARRVSVLEVRAPATTNLCIARLLLYIAQGALRP